MSETKTTTAEDLTDITDITDLPDFDTYDDKNNIAAVPSLSRDTASGMNVNDNYVSLQSSAFKDFVLKQELLTVINESGFEHPSEVQHQTIPQAILGSDILCQAKSGMGKTAVFVIAILQQDPPESVISSLVLCHTRELAFQVKGEFDRFKKYLSNIETVVFYGKTPVEQDRNYLKTKTPNVVIGTPGRILQLASEKALDLKYIKHFVIDECDKVLEQIDMRKDVQEIFKMTPRTKQTMMFSATMSEENRNVSRKFMHNPLEIFIDDGSKLTLHGLKQYYVKLSEAEKIDQLINLLDMLDFNQCIIFVDKAKRCVQLNHVLIDSGFPSICSHGRMEMKDRMLSFDKFKKFKARIMVCTDLLSRGIDIERVNVVVNFDMSRDSDTYLHRVGRAGRFGTKGLAISFISTSEDEQVLSDVQKKFVVEIPLMPDEIDSSTYRC